MMLVGIVCRCAKELRRYPKLTMIQLRVKIIAVIRVTDLDCNDVQ
jgi:hypothetical protein